MFKRSDNSQKTEDILAQIKSKISNQDSNSNNVSKSDELDDLLLSELSGDIEQSSEDKQTDINLLQNQEFLEDEADLIESTSTSTNDIEDLSSELDDYKKDINDNDSDDDEQKDDILNDNDSDDDEQKDYILNDNDSDDDFKLNYNHSQTDEKHSKVSIPDEKKTNTIANSINKLQKIIETRKEVKKNFGDLTMNDIVAGIVKEKITEYIENYLEDQLPNIVNDVVEREIKKIIDESKALN